MMLGAALALLIGVALGLLGGGGSMLTVPILLYVFALPPRVAITTSLLVVGATSLAALVPHARAGRVRWGTGAVFGATSMVGAFGAGRVSRHLPASALLLAFGVMMAVTAVAMLRRRTAAAPRASAPASPVRAIALGLAVGAATGLVGAGGGFVVVPALALFGGLPMASAVGTSLLVIAMNSLAGFAGNAAGVEVPRAIAGLVVAAAVVGSFVGARLVRHVAPDRLRVGFGWFVVAMAVYVLGQEVPKRFGVTLSVAAHWPWGLVTLALPPTLWLLAGHRRAVAGV